MQETSPDKPVTGDPHGGDRSPVRAPFIADGPSRAGVRLSASGTLAVTALLRARLVPAGAADRAALAR